MTAAGTFALDTNTYLTASGISGMTQYGLGVAATATTMTSSVQPASWTTGHTFVPVWQPSGSALAPVVVDANTLVVAAAATVTCTYNASGTTSFPGASNTQAGCPISTTHSTSTTFQPTGLVTWGTYTAIITQDSTGGGVTFTLGTTASAGDCYAWKITGGGSGAIVLSSAANAQDELVFTYDGTNCRATLLPNQN
jgi:hypothetical protein